MHVTARLVLVRLVRGHGSACHDTPAVRERARRAAVRFLLKPFDREALIAAVRRSISDG
jgi:FixJ family two-component response regulator